MTVAGVRRLGVLSAVAGVTMALAACSGGSTGMALLTHVDDSQQTPDQVGFNPFSQKSEAEQTAREVIANPTLAEVMEAGPLSEMSWGRADAPVTLVQYASMSCPHCRHFHLTTYPQLKRDYIDTGKVRYILREFPIGHSSGVATIALRCAPPDKYMALYGKFMEQQGNWVSLQIRSDEIAKVAAQVGVSGEQFNACMKNQDMIAKLAQIKNRGRKLGVIGTPNFFVNGKLVKSEIGIGDINLAVMTAENKPRPVASAAQALRK